MVFIYTTISYFFNFFVKSCPKGKKNHEASVHPTASSEWVQRTHSELVSLACVHRGHIQFLFIISKFRPNFGLMRWREIFSTIYKKDTTFHYFCIFPWIRFLVMILKFWPNVGLMRWRENKSITKWQNVPGI